MSDGWLRYDSTPVTPLQNLVVPPYSAGPSWREQSSTHTHPNTPRGGSIACDEVHKESTESEREWRESECEGFKWFSDVAYGLLLVLLCVMWSGCLDTCLLLLFVRRRGCLMDNLSNFSTRCFVGSSHVDCIVWMSDVLLLREMNVCVGARLGVGHVGRF